MVQNCMGSGSPSCFLSLLVNSYTVRAPAILVWHSAVILPLPVEAGRLHCMPGAIPSPLKSKVYPESNRDTGIRIPCANHYTRVSLSWVAD